MKRKCIFLLFLIGTLHLFADILPNPIELKSIITNADSKVQLVTEKVVAWVYRDSSIVECEYSMKNWGTESTVEVGLPMMLFSYWSADAYQDNINQFVEIYVESKKLDKTNLYMPQTAKDLKERIRLCNAYRDSTYNTYRATAAQLHGKNSEEYGKAFREMMTNFMKNDKTYEDVIPSSLITQLERKNIPFYVWMVNFKPLEPVTIKVKYSVPSGMTYKDSAKFFNYLLSTGAGWYKSIEKADVRVRLMDVDMNMISVSRPSNFQKNTTLKEFSWSFNALEPTKGDDIYLEYVVPKKTATKK